MGPAPARPSLPSPGVAGSRSGPPRSPAGRPAGPPPGRPPSGPIPSGPPSRPATSRQRPAPPPPEPDPLPQGPRTFEIRRGRASKDDEHEREAPLGAVVLPRSITQEAEEERLKGRFGVDRLPEVQEVNSLVRMTESQGTLGPDRTRGKMVVALLLLVVAVAGGLAYAHKQGLLSGLLGGS